MCARPPTYIIHSYNVCIFDDALRNTHLMLWILFLLESRSSLSLSTFSFSDCGFVYDVRVRESTIGTIRGCASRSEIMAYRVIQRMLLDGWRDKKERRQP
jgi:hypothetical protein